VTPGLSLALTLGLALALALGLPLALATVATDNLFIVTL